MLRYVSVFSASILLSSVALAQTPATHSTLQKSYLQTRLELAKADLKKNQNLLNIEIDKIEGYDACKVNELSAYKKYDQWFVDHYSSLEAFSTKIDSIASDANTKIVSLGEQSIKVLPKEGQNSSDVLVTLKSMVEYFKIYNGRMKTCTPQSKQELLKHMEDPTKNKLGLAHSQVVAAMESMTKNLNASLQEQNVTYELVFTPSDCGYQLELAVKLDFNGIHQEYKFTVLGDQNSSGEQIHLDEEAKWLALLKKEEKFDGVPLDAMKRLKFFLDQEKGACLDFPLALNIASDELFAVKDVLLKRVSEIRASRNLHGSKGLGVFEFNRNEFTFCDEMNGTYKSTTSEHEISLINVCELKKVGTKGDSWGDYAEFNADLRKNKIIIHTSYDNEIELISKNELKWTNLRWGNTLTFIRK